MSTQTLNKLLAALNECTEWGQVGWTGRGARAGGERLAAGNGGMGK